MDERQTLLQLAKAMQAIISLQMNEVRSSGALAMALEEFLPGLNQKYLAKQTIVPPLHDTLRPLQEKIDEIVRDLSK